MILILSYLIVALEVNLDLVYQPFISVYSVLKEQ